MLVDDWFCEDLGIGTIRALFQELGTTPEDSDKLKGLVREEEIEPATDFNIMADMPSGPIDLIHLALMNVDQQTHRISIVGSYTGEWTVCANIISHLV